MFTLVLQFPFKIKQKEVEHTVTTNIERKENLVSFALIYKYPITIKDAVCVSVTYTDDLYVYVFSFQDINKAIDFMTDTKVEVNKTYEFPNVDELVDKTNKLMLDYEKNEKSHNRKKKRRVVIKDIEGVGRCFSISRRIF